MAKTYTINQNDTLKSIVAKHVPKGASKKEIEVATLALLETNPQLDVMKPKDGMKLTIPNGAVSISPRTMERYRVNQAMEKGEKNIPVSKEYINELLEKMEKTQTGRAIASKLREAIKTGDIKFAYKHDGNPIASFQSGDKGTGIMYLDSRNFLGINDPNNRAGKHDPVKGFQTADYFNVGLILHEGVHFLTHQARHNGTLKGGKNTMADETVAYSAQYDFIKELKKSGIKQVVPDSYSDAEKLPWNKKVIEYEKRINQFKVKSKDGIEFIVFEDKGPRLLKAAELDKSHKIFSAVKHDIKNGIVKGPLDYIAIDRARDKSYTNTANFLSQRLPTYWGNELQSKADRQKYHQDVQKIIDGLKQSSSKTKNGKVLKSSDKQSSNSVPEDKTVDNTDHSSKKQNPIEKSSVQVSNLMHEKMSEQQQKIENRLAQTEQQGREIG